MRITVAILAVFAPQARADLNPTTEAELRRELSETKAQIDELRELIKIQQQPEPGRAIVAVGRGGTITAQTILQAANEDFSEDRRRLAADAGRVIPSIFLKT